MPETTVMACQQGETGALCPLGLDLWRKAVDAQDAYLDDGADPESRLYREKRHRWKVYRNHLTMCRRGEAE